jgi:hypothetical protein
MVLAFRDEHAESNKMFVAIAGELDRLGQASGDGAKLPDGMRKEDVKVYKLLWKTNPPAPALREMVARALRHNKLNDPKNFPKLDNIEKLCSPPTVRQRAAKG